MVDAEKRRLDRIGVAVGALAMVVIAVLFMLPRWLAPEPSDPDTLCLTKKALSAHTIILVDRTDPLPRADVAELRRLVLSEQKRLATFERISIHLITDSTDGALLRPFSLCNPLSGSKADPVYQNPKAIEEAWVTKFGQPFNVVLDQLSEPVTAPRSPIAATILTLARQGDFSSKVKARRLVIISDFMEHSDQYSHYRQNIRFEDIFTLPALAGEGALLSGIEVVALYVRRANLSAFQTTRHQQFWRGFFHRFGAELKCVETSFMPLC